MQLKTTKMDKKILLALLAIWLLVFALVGFVSAPKQGLSFNRTDIGFSSACSYYAIEVDDKDNKENDLDLAGNFIIQGREYKNGKYEKHGRFKDNGRWEFLKVQNKTITVIDQVIPYEVAMPGTCIDNLTNSTYSCNQTEIKYNYTYKEIFVDNSTWTAEKIKFKKNTITQARYCSSFEREFVEGRGWTIEADHIPQLAGKNYEGMAWWNSSYSTRYQITINNTENIPHEKEIIKINLTPTICDDSGTLKNSTRVVLNDAEEVDFETYNASFGMIYAIANFSIPANFVSTNLFIYCNTTTQTFAGNKSIFLGRDNFEGLTVHSQAGIKAEWTTFSSRGKCQSWGGAGVSKEGSVSLNCTSDGNGDQNLAFKLTSSVSQTVFVNFYARVDGVANYHPGKYGLGDGSVSYDYGGGSTQILGDTAKGNWTTATTDLRVQNLTHQLWETFKFEFNPANQNNSIYVNGIYKRTVNTAYGTVSSVQGFTLGGWGIGSNSAQVDNLFISIYNSTIYETPSTVSIGQSESNVGGVTPMGSGGPEAVIESNSSGSIILSPATGGKVKFMASLTDGSNEISIANMKNAYDHALQDSIRSILDWQNNCNSCIGANDINANEVQRRISGVCAIGSSIREIQPDGAVICEPDDLGSGSGGGDITDVWPATGSGLTGGSFSGSVSIGTDFNTIQKRISSVCAAGSSIREILSDGTVTCEPDDLGSGSGGGDITDVFSGVGTKGGSTTGAATIEFACSEVAGSHVSCSGETINVNDDWVNTGGDVMSGDLTINKNIPKISLKTTSSTTGSVVYSNEDLYLNAGDSATAPYTAWDADGDGIVSDFEVTNCRYLWGKGLIGDFSLLACINDGASSPKTPRDDSVIVNAIELVPAYNSKIDLGNNDVRWKTGYFDTVVNRVNTIGDVREYYKENPSYKYEIGMAVAIDTDSGYEIKPLVDVTDRVVGVVAEVPYNTTKTICDGVWCYNVTQHIDTNVAIYGKFSPVKVKGTIQVGDYLVASDEPGVVTSMYEKEHPFNPSAFKKSKNKREYNFNAKMFPTLGIAMENYNSTQVGTIKVVLGK